jgi:Xaa-Pro aminopeptidase
MTDIQVELAQIDLPDFGHPAVQPRIEGPEYEARLETVWERAVERGLNTLLVYGDREHFANLAFLTGYDPRFEEALLILNGDGPPVLLVGNEGWGYSQISSVNLERRLYQPFSLMGQDRSKSDPLPKILRDANLHQGTKVGLIDWKYFDPEAGGAPELQLNAPAYIVDTLREVTGQSPINTTDLLMNPRDGLRVISSVDQLACFEFAATCVSNAMRRILWGLRPGMSEFEAMEKARLNGLPLSCHPMFSAGPLAALGLPSPSNRRMQLGDPVTLALGVWGALNARAGFLVHDESELPSEIRDYVERLVKPYFAAIVEWYQHVGLGVKGGELYEIIHHRLGDSFFGISLNPGHLIHLDEWVHSSIYSGSNAELRSGMALQVDVIPATGGPYFTTNIEDTIILADEALRQAFAIRWPEAWSRIQARRTFMKDELNIELKPEVLPFSNLAAFLPPYLLDPSKGVRVSSQPYPRC